MMGNMPQVFLVGMKNNYIRMLVLIQTHNKIQHLPNMNLLAHIIALIILKSYQTQNKRISGIENANIIRGTTNDYGCVKQSVHHKT